jgi:hypothetical protein
VAAPGSPQEFAVNVATWSISRGQLGA